MPYYYVEMTVEEAVSRGISPFDEAVDCTTVGDVANQWDEWLQDLEDTDDKEAKELQQHYGWDNLSSVRQEQFKHFYAEHIGGDPWFALYELLTQFTKEDKDA